MLSRRLSADILASWHIAFCITTGDRRQETAITTANAVYWAVSRVWSCYVRRLILVLYSSYSRPPGGSDNTDLHANDSSCVGCAVILNHRRPCLTDLPLHRPHQCVCCVGLVLKQCSAVFQIIIIITRTIFIMMSSWPHASVAQLAETVRTEIIKKVNVVHLI